MVECPICSRQVQSSQINAHIDSGCQTHILEATATSAANSSSPNEPAASTQQNGSSTTVSLSQKRPAASFFQTPASKRQATPVKVLAPSTNGLNSAQKPTTNLKRSFDDGPGLDSPAGDSPAPGDANAVVDASPAPAAKRAKTNKAAPLAERMRPTTLDSVFGQDLVGPNGVLRSLIESDRVPSMILWGASGTGKTTIARCIASLSNARFIELNATSSGVAECKRLFAEAANEQGLTGRKTIVFCDEIHRFSKSQQDVFLGPVEAGRIILIGATTENPSFKVGHALLSRCRTFVLSKLTAEDLLRIMKRALESELADRGTSMEQVSPLLDEEMLTYLSNFADGDARTALNLLELALSLSVKEGMTKEDMKSSLTKTLVYDRAGDQHYDSISAFHKSVRGSDPDAALYYLARMLQSGEDVLFIARRMVVIASEDVGLADNTMLPLATATYTAAQQIGMPEARISLAHCAVALSLAPKSTRAYRGLNSAFAALREPGVASLPVPVHLRNAPTRLMKELGYGAEYKYNPNYKDGKVKQDYLPEDLLGRKFLDDRDLGTEIDPDLKPEEEDVKLEDA